MARQPASCGITPIYMGSTSSLLGNGRLMEDHPHIHGEHSSPRDASAVVAGSPPYTWGAPEETTDCIPSVRITPIYMGSTCIHGLANIHIGDHPHIHGEHKRIIRSMTARKGSPPYTWGAPGKKEVIVTGKRITPIYMGSTTTPLRRPCSM